MFLIKNCLQILLVLYLSSCVCSQYHRNRGRRGSQKSPLTSAIPLSNEDHNKYLVPLVEKGWTIDKNVTQVKMKKDFMFKSFFGAFGFMSNIAMHCEETNHFPEWFNVYKVVKITLSTKHIKSLSIRDVILANYIEQVFGFYKLV